MLIMIFREIIWKLHKVLEQETGGTQTKKYAELEVYISGSNIPDFTRR